ncbi:NUDIX domain-containing protein [Saccharopolyspora sp. NPDC050642]|uniref:NUDIX domain-containing protein n=1 Tax=Saccharopolyspora sp. NPDC050642 TaxID=3157099 RepID=UPI0033EED72F
MHLAEVADLARRDAADGVQQQIVAAVIDTGGQVLLVRRRETDSRGGEWEFPGGKVDPGEDLNTALHREVDEETGLHIAEITGYLGAFDYITRSGTYNRQHTWSVTVAAAEGVRLTEHDAYAWVSAADEIPLSADLEGILEKHFKS